MKFYIIIIILSPRVQEPSWSPRPNEPYGFYGRKATFKHTYRHWSQFVPNISTRHPKTLSSTSSSCCITSTEAVQKNAVYLDKTQLANFRGNVFGSCFGPLTVIVVSHLRPQKPSGLLGTRSPGRSLRLWHSSELCNTLHTASSSYSNNHQAY